MPGNNQETSKGLVAALRNWYEIKGWPHLRDAADRIEQLEATLENSGIKWISVTDRLPPPRQVVIVSGGVGYLGDDGTWMTVTGFEYPGRPILWEVTHWAELEQQPKELS